MSVTATKPTLRFAKQQRLESAKRRLLHNLSKFVVSRFFSRRGKKSSPRVENPSSWLSLAPHWRKTAACIHTLQRAGQTERTLVSTLWFIETHESDCLLWRPFHRFGNLLRRYRFLTKLLLHVAFFFVTNTFYRNISVLWCRSPRRQSGRTHKYVLNFVFIFR